VKIQTQQRCILDRLKGGFGCVALPRSCAIPSLYQRREDHHEHIENTHSDDSSPGHELGEKILMVWYGIFLYQRSLMAYHIPFIMYAAN
jgi:hypothetical protein